MHAQERSALTFHMPVVPTTIACPPSFPSVPTSMLTRVISDARVCSWVTMPLMVSLRSSISPLTSISTCFVKSPTATALVTSEIDRTWPVRFMAIFCEFVGQKVGTDNEETYVDIVGESLPRSLNALDLCLSAQFSFRADFERDSSDFARKDAELRHHVVDGGLQVEHLALDIDLDLLGEIATGDSGGDVGDRPDLVGDVERHFLRRDDDRITV
jgi:hypothetical protein